MDTQNSPRPDPLVILWFALASSSIVYGAIVWFVVGPRATEDIRPFSVWMEEPVVGLLYGMAAVSFAAASWVSRALLRKAPRPARPPLEGEIPMVVRQALIVRWAIVESIAIHGLVVAFITNNPLLFVPPAALCLIGFVMSFPSRRLLDDLVSIIGS